MRTAIEYQGHHHFGSGRFATPCVQVRDQIKRDWCRKNSVDLIEIPYWEDVGKSLGHLATSPGPA